MGIVAGLVMLRWGIWVTLTWHYTVDAFLISTSLLRSHGAYLKISGAIVGGGALEVPLAIAGISYLARGRFETSPALLNSARSLVVSPAISPGIVPDIVLEQHARRGGARNNRTAASGVRSDVFAVAHNPDRRGIGGGRCVARAGIKAGSHRRLCALFRFAPAKLRRARTEFSGITISIPPVTGTRRHNYVHIRRLQQRIPGPKDWRRSRKPHLSSAGSSAFWTVRYFRDSQNEEYFVVLKPDGSLHSLHHTLDEKTSGANLSKEEALALAEAYLRDQKQIDLSVWNLVDSSTGGATSRPNGHNVHLGTKNCARRSRSASGAHVGACKPKCRAMRTLGIVSLSRFPTPGAINRAARLRRSCCRCSASLWWGSVL